MLAPRFSCCRRKVLRISKKVEPKADNFVQTREIEKLNLGIDLGTEAALSHRVRTKCTKKI